MAVVWLAGMLYVDKLFWALAGLSVVAAGHAVILAFELALQRWVGRHDGAPRARPLQVLNAWWAETLAAAWVFCWLQPFRSNAVPDHLSSALTDKLPPTGGGQVARRGVIFVHGFVCNRGIWNPCLTRLRALEIPFIAVNLEPVFGSIDNHPPMVEAAVAKMIKATGLAPVIVAHSMGGLVSRAWLQRYDPTHSRVSRIITIGTPHRGTFLANFGGSVSARQMRLNSPWLQALAAQESHPHYQHFTCFYSHCDNVSFPVSTGTLPGADNRHLAACAHVQLVSRDEVFAELVRRARK